MSPPLHRTPSSTVDTADEILDIAASLHTARARTDDESTFTILGVPWSHIATNDAISVDDMRDKMKAAAKTNPETTLVGAGSLAPTTYSTDIDFLSRVLYTNMNAFLNHILREIHISILLDARVQGAVKLLFDETTADEEALSRLRSNPTFMRDLEKMGTRDDKRWTIMMFFCHLEDMQRIAIDPQAVGEFVRNTPEDARLEFRAADPQSFSELLPQLRYVAQQSLQMRITNDKMLSEMCRIYQLHCQRIGLSTTAALIRASQTHFPETWS